MLLPGNFTFVSLYLPNYVMICVLISCLLKDIFLILETVLGEMREH